MAKMSIAMLNLPEVYVQESQSHHVIYWASVAWEANERMGRLLRQADGFAGYLLARFSGGFTLQSP